MSREQVKHTIINTKASHILAELPTSYGKSRIALELMDSRCSSRSKILIVIPRLVLINNWKDEFRKWGYSEYLPAVDFVTYVSLPKKAGVWDFVIFDEVHHLSERCRESLRAFTIKNSILLSATVKKDMRYELFQIFPTLQVIKVQVKEAIKEDILPDPKVYLIPLELDDRENTHFIIRNKQKGDPITIDYKDKWKYINVKHRKILIKCTQKQYYDDITSLIEWYKKKINSRVFKNLFLHTSGNRLKWLSDQKTSFILSLLEYLRKERTLTFCNNIAQTEILGTNCINSKNRFASVILDEYNKGRIKHITACAMLDEGINLKNCRVGIYANLNSSERIIKQRLGRLLRHKDPIIIIPYFKGTRDEEIVQKMCEDYNPELIKIINDIKQIEL